MSRLRLGALLSLIAAFGVLSVTWPDLFQLSTSLALVVLPAINLLAAVVLRRASRQAPEIISLANRADDAVVLFVASALGGILGLNRLLTLELQNDVAVGILALALVLQSLPAIDWLRIWRDVWAPRIRRR